MDGSGTLESIWAELDHGLTGAMERIRRFASGLLLESRTVGKKALPTTVAGLLVHVADHTQRHVGQAITTAKVVRKQPQRSHS